MKFKEKNSRYRRDKDWIGKKNKYKCTITYSELYNKFYFTIHKEDNTDSYNSLWDNLKYNTLEECQRACEELVDKRVKRGK